MKLAEIFERSAELDALNDHSARARKEVERTKAITKTMSDGNKGAKNVEHGFRSAIKRQYKNIVKDEAS